MAHHEHEPYPAFIHLVHTRALFVGGTRSLAWHLLEPFIAVEAMPICAIEEVWTIIVLDGGLSALSALSDVDDNPL